MTGKPNVQWRGCLLLCLCTPAAGRGAGFNIYTYYLLCIYVYTQFGLQRGPIPTSSSPASARWDSEQGKTTPLHLALCCAPYVAILGGSPSLHHPFPGLLGVEGNPSAVGKGLGQVVGSPVSALERSRRITPLWFSVALGANAGSCPSQ